MRKDEHMNTDYDQKIELLDACTWLLYRLERANQLLNEAATPPCDEDNAEDEACMQFARHQIAGCEVKP